MGSRKLLEDGKTGVRTIVGTSYFSLGVQGCIKRGGGGGGGGREGGKSPPPPRIFLTFFSYDYDHQSVSSLSRLSIESASESV